MEIFPALKYRVRIVDMDIEITGHMSGKMKMNRITIMEGDYVKIELNEYDMSQGRIVYRFKDPQQALASREQESTDIVN